MSSSRRATKGSSRRTSVPLGKSLKPDSKEITNLKKTTPQNNQNSFASGVSKENQQKSKELTPEERELYQIVKQSRKKRGIKNDSVESSNKSLSKRYKTPSPITTLSSKAEKTSTTRKLNLSPRTKSADTSVQNKKQSAKSLKNSNMIIEEEKNEESQDDEEEDDEDDDSDDEESDESQEDEEDNNEEVDQKNRKTKSDKKLNRKIEDSELEEEEEEDEKESLKNKNKKNKNKKDDNKSKEKEAEEKDDEEEEEEEEEEEKAEKEEAEKTPDLKPVDLSVPDPLSDFIRDTQGRLTPRSEIFGTESRREGEVKSASKTPKKAEITPFTAQEHIRSSQKKAGLRTPKLPNMLDSLLEDSDYEIQINITQIDEEGGELSQDLRGKEFRDSSNQKKLSSHKRLAKEIEQPKGYWDLLNEIDKKQKIEEPKRKRIDNKENEIVFHKTGEGQFEEPTEVLRVIVPDGIDQDEEELSQLLKNKKVPEKQTRLGEADINTMERNEHTEINDKRIEEEDKSFIDNVASQKKSDTLNESMVVELMKIMEENQDLLKGRSKPEEGNVERMEVEEEEDDEKNERKRNIEEAFGILNIGDKSENLSEMIVENARYSQKETELFTNSLEESKDQAQLSSIDIRKTQEQNRTNKDSEVIEEEPIIEESNKKDQASKNKISEMRDSENEEYDEALERIGEIEEIEDLKSPGQTDSSFEEKNYQDEDKKPNKVPNADKLYLNGNTSNKKNINRSRAGSEGSEDLEKLKELAEIEEIGPKDEGANKEGLDEELEYELEEGLGEKIVDLESGAEAEPEDKEEEEDEHEEGEGEKEKSRHSDNEGRSDGKSQEEEANPEQSSLNEDSEVSSEGQEDKSAPNNRLFENNQEAQRYVDASSTAPLVRKESESSDEEERSKKSLSKIQEEEGEDSSGESQPFQKIKSVQEGPEQVQNEEGEEEFEVEYSEEDDERGRPEEADSFEIYQEEKPAIQPNNTDQDLNLNAEYSQDITVPSFFERSSRNKNLAGDQEGQRATNRIPSEFSIQDEGEEGEEEEEENKEAEQEAEEYEDEKEDAEEPEEENEQEEQEDEGEDQGFEEDDAPLSEQIKIEDVEEEKIAEEAARGFGRSDQQQPKRTNNSNIQESLARKEYTAYEDWRLIETVKRYIQRNGDKGINSKNTWETIKDPMTGKRLLDGVRSGESMRNRVRRTLNILSDEDKDFIANYMKTHSIEEVKSQYCRFEKDKWTGEKKFKGIYKLLNYDPEKLTKKNNDSNPRGIGLTTSKTFKRNQQKKGQVESAFEKSDFEDDIENIESQSKSQSKLEKLLNNPENFFTSSRVLTSSIIKPKIKSAADSEVERVFLYDEDGKATTFKITSYHPPTNKHHIYDDIEEDSTIMKKDSPYKSHKKVENKPQKKRKDYDDREAMALQRNCELKKIKQNVYFEQKSLIVSDAFKIRKEHEIEILHKDDIRIFVDSEQKFRQFVKEDEETIEESQHDKLEKLSLLAKKYRISLEKIKGLFNQVSYDFEDLESYLKTKKVGILWSADEDRDLLEANPKAIYYLRMVKGEERMEKRRKYLIGE